MISVFSTKSKSWNLVCHFNIPWLRPFWTTVSVSMWWNVVSYLMFWPRLSGVSLETQSKWKLKTPVVSFSKNLYHCCSFLDSQVSYLIWHGFLFILKKWVSFVKSTWVLFFFGDLNFFHYLTCGFLLFWTHGSLVSCGQLNCKLDI